MCSLFQATFSGILVEVNYYGCYKNIIALAWPQPTNLKKPQSPPSGLLRKPCISHISLFYLVPWTSPTVKEKEAIKKGRQAREKIKYETMGSIQNQYDSYACHAKGSHSTTRFC